MGKSRKWIKSEMEKLHPEKDYEQIWRLSISYKLDDFIMNLFYAAMFPNIIVPEQAARPVWREDGGKVLHRSTHRAQQTGNFVSLVSWYGASDPRTRKAVDHINSLHRHWMKRYPGDFSDVNDYIYTLSTFAVLQDRLLVTLGLPGLSEKEKVAAHLFWRDISQLFYTEGRKPLQQFPGDWNEMISYMEKIENSRVPGTKQAHLAAEAFFDQFAFRYFPWGLRWLGRMLPVCLCLPTTLEALDIQPVNSILSWFVKQCLAIWITVLIDWLPDPKKADWEVREEQTPSERVKQNKRASDLDKGFVMYFSRRHRAEIEDIS
ncbi:uncharacterized protein APUU_60999A [Aspergillus puulaauensis]|uniref:ER-bound oxygenase mpaB/mpaB'/Rubber oxygenase catalytic domain-containing protein n=1 Tax=Aspergillus puulaauensis TaxID=1220207 RepID=A0A7R7XUR9_9EURO|nr:uncharacterized protein APUU_60999A [Aspergillus puulaauensis]BCS27951.1 hypothetical protein APUU_60999A [Aspergillus puulaauensis]